MKVILLRKANLKREIYICWAGMLGSTPNSRRWSAVIVIFVSMQNKKCKQYIHPFLCLSDPPSNFLELQSAYLKIYIFILLNRTALSCLEECWTFLFFLLFLVSLKNKTFKTSLKRTAHRFAQLSSGQR